MDSGHFYFHSVYHTVLGRYYQENGLETQSSKPLSSPQTYKQNWNLPKFSNGTRGRAPKTLKEETWEKQERFSELPLGPGVFDRESWNLILIPGLDL